MKLVRVIQERERRAGSWVERDEIIVGREASQVILSEYLVF